MLTEGQAAANRQRRQDEHPIDAVQRAVRLAKEFRDKYEWCQKGQNEGQCMAAADELSRYVESENIWLTTVCFGTYDGKAHCWLEVWDKTNQCYYVIDPTADQFGDDIPEIVWGKFEDLPQYEYEKSDDN